MQRDMTGAELAACAILGRHSTEHPMLGEWIQRIVSEPAFIEDLHKGNVSGEDWRYAVTEAQVLVYPYRSSKMEQAKDAALRALATAVINHRRRPQAGTAHESLLAAAVADFTVALVPAYEKDAGLQLRD